MKKLKNYKLISLLFLVFILFLSPINAHEEQHGSLIIYHPYLIKETEQEVSRSYGFLTIENLGEDSEYLMDIIPKFSSSFEIWKRKGASENYIKVDLNEGLEISGGEAIYFDEDTFKLIFLTEKKGLEWLDPHLAKFIFKKAGNIELDFEVEQ